MPDLFFVSRLTHLQMATEIAPGGWALSVPSSRSPFRSSEMLSRLRSLQTGRSVKVVGEGPHALQSLEAEH